jgi:glycosyltransferase involved in cell wall biosynthesis
MNRRVLIIIPAFDEDSTIQDVVKKAKKYGDVLVVNDGSKDNTGLLAKNSGATVISNEKNLGYEYSLNIGYLYAIKYEYEIMLTLDADGQLPHYLIPSFISFIEKGFAVVVGKRFTIFRKAEILLAKISFIVSGIADPYCGMKAYDLTIKKQKYFSRYNSIGTSLVFDYFSLNLPIKNIDITVSDRSGKSKFGGKIISEIRLIPSLFIGSLRLIFLYISRKYYKIFNKEIN